jgi:predicted ATP-dependent endonuclease of OLD family
LIPHWEKKPAINGVVLSNLREFIFAGEVGSIKKYIYAWKTEGTLTPVWFSDQRIAIDCGDWSSRQTYIDINEINVQSINHCLKDKAKIALTENDGNKLFPIGNQDIMLSTSLTVILGARSTGKTHTLDAISESFDNAKYIRQFELLELDENGAAENFEMDKKTDRSRFVEKYLHEFKLAVEDVADVDTDSDEAAVDNYIMSLIKHASEQDRADAYSRAHLFNSDSFSERKLDNLMELINATELLLSNQEFKETIGKYLSRDSLVGLYIDFIEQYQSGYELNLKYRWVNSLAMSITRALQQRSANTPIGNLDSYEIMLNKAKVKRFNDLCKAVRIPKKIEISEIGKYKTVADIQPYSRAQELRTQSGRRGLSFSNAYAKYNDSYNYLLELKQIGGLSSAECYKYFVKIDYKILNSLDLEVSGGERAEFNLLKNIQDALKHDILLIDEPESSFDNVFLREGVNSLIKEISKNIPVVVVTHNNTVGASVKADYFLYTKRDTVNGSAVFSIFSGYPSDKELHDNSGNSIKSYDVQVNSLEAGEPSYHERRSLYEALKD